MPSPSSIKTIKDGNMSEGGLGAPIRHNIPWRDEDFTNPELLDAELRRVFDICHGCRRCFNLCDSFPKLFDLIDESETGELDSVDSKDFKPVIDDCTLCDMCFMTKCPYVPPHEFDLDFPHLMLRARAVQNKQGKTKFVEKQLTETDRNGKIGCGFSGITNWASKTDNSLTRPIMEKTLGIHKDAYLPKFEKKTLRQQLAEAKIEINKDAPAYGRKAVIYATCFSEFNNADIGVAARAVLAKNGVETEVVYPACCGMPQMEHGDLAKVAENAEKVAKELTPWIEKGYDVISLVASCSLMLKFEWPLIVPENEHVVNLAKSTFDIDEYVMDISAKEGLAEGLAPLDGGVTMHMSCHARAQNMGQKGAEMLKLIPETSVGVIERCSGHGGSWGVMKDNFETALKVGKPVARKVAKNTTPYIVSECPLAREHILQGVEKLDGDISNTKDAQHPIQLLALSYGLNK